MWKAIVAILTSPIVGRSRSEMCVTASTAFDVAHPQSVAYAADPKPIAAPAGDVRFTPESGHSERRDRCPLSANRRHR